MRSIITERARARVVTQSYVRRTHGDGHSAEAARGGPGRPASPGNHGSIRFHAALGFTVGGPVRDYNGPGRDMATFELNL